MPPGNKDLALDSQEVLRRAQRTLVEAGDVQAGKAKFAAAIDNAEARRNSDEAYYMKSVTGRSMPAVGTQASAALSGLAERFADAASGSLRLLAEAASQGVGMTLDYDAATKESFGSSTTPGSTGSVAGSILRASGSAAVYSILTTAQVGMFAIDMGNEMGQLAFNGANYTADVLAAASGAAVRGVSGAVEFVADTATATGVAAIRGIYGAVEVLADGTVGFVGATARGVAGAAEGAVDGFAALTGGFIRVGTSAPTAVLNMSTDVAGALVRGGAGIAGGLLNLTGDVFSLPFQGVGAIADVVGADGVAEQIRGVGDLGSGLGEGLDKVITGAADFTTDALSKGTEVLHNANTWTVDHVTDAAYWGVDRVTDAGTWAVDNVTDGIYAVQDKATDGVSAVVDWSTDGVFAVVDKTTDAGTWVVDNATDASYALTDKITDLPGGVLNAQDRLIEATQDKIGDIK